MKLGELTNRLRDLGFTDDSDMSENASLLISSLNNALQTINKTVEGVKGTYAVTVEDGEEGLIDIDLYEETEDDEGNVTFETLDGMPNYRPVNASYEIDFSDYRLDAERYLVLNAFRTGTYTFYYRKRVPLVDETWTEEDELPIEYAVEHMLPLLTAYYMWLDDDAEIATRWYNEYDTLKAEYLTRKAEKSLRATIRSDLNRTPILDW